MDELLLIGRSALAVVFALAALGKFADLLGVRRTLEEFGVPPSLTAAGAIALPVAELAVAALLLPTVTARAGALAALALLVAFCIAIGRALRRGERPDCSCFGRARPRAIDPWTLARNAALAAVAGTIAFAGTGAGLGEALGGLEAAPLAILLGFALAVQAWFSWQLFRQHGRLLTRVSALEAAAEARPPANLTVIHRHRQRRRSVDERLRALER